MNPAGALLQMAMTDRYAVPARRTTLAAILAAMGVPRRIGRGYDQRPWGRCSHLAAVLVRRLDRRRPFVSCWQRSDRRHIGLLWRRISGHACRASPGMGLPTAEGHLSDLSVACGAP